jgi:hypothetical protein
VNARWGKLRAYLLGRYMLPCLLMLVAAVAVATGQVSPVLAAAACCHG